jgi:hypothetical protein
MCRLGWFYTSLLFHKDDKIMRDIYITLGMTLKIMARGGYNCYVKSIYILVFHTKFKWKKFLVTWRKTITVDVIHES